MRALITLTAVAMVAVAVSPSLAAQSGEKVLRGAVDPLPFGADGRILAKFRGWVRLVDGKGSDEVRIRVRGLRRNTTYEWHIHAVKTTAAPEPCAQHVSHPLARGFKPYPPLETNGRGRSQATATARRFKARSSKTYYVHVDRPSDGIAVACGVVEPVEPKPPEPAP